MYHILTIPEDISINITLQTHFIFAVSNPHGNLVSAMKDTDNTRSGTHIRCVSDKKD